MSIAPTVSARVFQNTTTEVHIGILAGLISWSSNYENRAVYDQGDPLGIDRLNLIEVNTGAGVSVQHLSSKGWIQGGVSASQLSGNLIASPLEGFRLFPNLKGELSYLLPAMEGIYVGPRVFYQNILNDSLKMGPGQVHLGVVGRMPEKGLWAGGMYRMDASVVSVAFGFPILKLDPKADPYEFHQSLDATFGMHYPVNARDAFGPSVDLGLVWNFGKESSAALDTLPFARPFWINESALVEHKQQFLDPVGPGELKGQSEIYDKNIYLTYTWPDRSRLYCGEDPASTRDGLVRRIGYEWIGMDGVLRGVAGKVIPDALFPDSSGVRDPENMEALEHLAWIELSCQLRVDEEGARFSSEMVYDGEFGMNNEGGDSLIMPIVLDGRDTVITIAENVYLSNLELAALKLYVLRSRTEYEMWGRFGDRYRIVKEEELREYDLESEIDNWKRPIIIRRPRITSDNPNLQAFQQNSILLKFPRNARAVTKDNGKWIPNEDPAEDFEEWELPDTDSETNTKD